MTQLKYVMITAMIPRVYWAPHALMMTCSYYCYCCTISKRLVDWQKMCL